MKTIVVAALLALSFTTGFTCSKNQPAETAPDQETMAAPADASAAPVDETAVPPEGTPAEEAAPAAETK